MVELGALDEMRVELIHGFLCDMTPPSPEHDNVIVYLNRLLATCVDPELYEVRPQMGLTIRNSAPQPDLAVVRNETPRPYYPATAALVIEVSRSSLHRDVFTKPAIYATADVDEYWVVDMDGVRVLVHRDPSSGGYRAVVELRPGDVIDGSIVGLGEILVADVINASGRR